MGMNVLKISSNLSLKVYTLGMLNWNSESLARDLKETTEQQNVVITHFWLIMVIHY